MLALVMHQRDLTTVLELVLVFLQLALASMKNNSNCKLHALSTHTSCL